MSKERSFEEALEELESIVKQLENGDVALEEAVKKYNNGMILSKYCHDKLKGAEEVIVKMMKDGQLGEFSSLKE